jgi:hypothetical protein
MLFREFRLYRLLDFATDSNQVVFVFRIFPVLKVTNVVAADDRRVFTFDKLKGLVNILVTEVD